MVSKPSLEDGKILEDILQGPVYVEGEHLLSDDDRRRCANALTLWLLVVGDIASSTELERTYSMANLLRWAGRPSIDVAQLQADMKACLAVLRDFDPVMGKRSFRSFKLWLKDRLSGNGVFEFLRPFFYRLFPFSVEAFGSLNTILQFFTRLTLRDAEWLDDDLVSSYVTLETDMREWKYPQTTLDCLRYLVTRWFDGFTIEGCHPNFSNGATAETKRGAGVASKVLAGKRSIRCALADAEISFHSPYFGGFDLNEPCAVWQSVPKGIDKRRGISMEPVVNQYYQYGLFKAFADWFSKGFGPHVKLEDQETSRMMCLIGSNTCRWSTIDLSSASDTVTWQLTCELFKDRPDILRYLDLVRTRFVKLPGGQVLEMAKYAPMGSSLCFPVECIVFAAVASYACWVSGIPQYYQVYGDDIIIDSRAYLACIDLLTDLHFEVNVDKSFGPASHFLEACGMEAYYGADVTPCRISRRFDIVKLRSGKSPQQLEGSITFANRLGEYGLTHARRYLIRDILDSYGQVPFSVDPEKGIYHPDPENFHLKRRWNKKLHRCEVQIICSHTSQLPGRQDIRLVRTLEEIELRTEAPYAFHNIGSFVDFDPQIVACGPTRTSLRKEWRPVWDFAG